MPISPFSPAVAFSVTDVAILRRQLLVGDAVSFVSSFEIWRRSPSSLARPEAGPPLPVEMAGEGGAAT